MPCTGRCTMRPISCADPHYQARDQLVTLPDADLGEVTMQGIVPKFPGRDHKISHPGRAQGWDNEEFYASWE